MPTQVMIDIETLGKRTDACIIQVAAVAFNIQTGERSHTFNGLIRNSGGKLDVDTVAWWMQQAHAPVLGAKLQDDSQAGDERQVLEALCSFFRLCGEVDQVWAHGGTGFDFPILQSAFERCGLAVPWHYRAPRDTRSLYDVAPGGMPRLPKDETREHDAQYDCEYQIAQVCAAWAALRARDQRVGYLEVQLDSAKNEAERWKEEYRVTEEARASFEAAYNQACAPRPAPPEPSPAEVLARESLHT